MNKLVTLSMLAACTQLLTMVNAKAATPSRSTIAVSAFVVPICNVGGTANDASVSCSHKDISYSVTKVRGSARDASNPVLSTDEPNADVVLTVITY